MHRSSVNGPIAKELGINGARCCLGPGKQNVVNTRIGRAFHMCLKNIARWVPGVTDLDSIGTARKNVVVLTENEDESPWEPYHVSQGYDPTDSTVTVVFTAGEWDISLQGHVDGVQLAHAIGSVGVANNTGCSLGTFGQDLESIPLGRMLPSHRHMRFRSPRPDFRSASSNTSCGRRASSRSAGS